MRRASQFSRGRHASEGTGCQDPERPSSHSLVQSPAWLCAAAATVRELGAGGQQPVTCSQHGARRSRRAARRPCVKAVSGRQRPFYEEEVYNQTASAFPIRFHLDSCSERLFPLDPSPTFSLLSIHTRHNLRGYAFRLRIDRQRAYRSRSAAVAQAAGLLLVWALVPGSGRHRTRYSVVCSR